MNPRPLFARCLALSIFAGSILSLHASFVVDSFLGGSDYGNAPFRGTRGITPQYQEAGGVFIPNQTSLLSSLGVSIFVQPGTTGSARMTIFRYDQPGIGVSSELGLNLGYASVPQADYGSLAVFDFSGQHIELVAGQMYVYLLSNPDATSFSGFDNSWRMAYFSGTPRYESHSSSTYEGFRYFTYPIGYGSHFQVLADPIPEPGAVVLAVAALVTTCVFARRRRDWSTKLFFS